MIKVSTSILSVKENEVKTFYNLEVAKTDYFHIDVMDGKFVKENTSQKMKENIISLKNITTLPLDVHLMVEDVFEAIDEYISFEPQIITFHYEAIKDKKQIYSIINKIKEENIKVGIAIKPNTPVEDIYEFLPYVHLALVMTVEPGEGGQKLIESTIGKIEKLSKFIKDNDLEVDIEADGGIYDGNIEVLKNAGIDIAVAGTYIIKSNNYSDAIKKLKI